MKKKAKGSEQPTSQQPQAGQPAHLGEPRAASTPNQPEDHHHDSTVNRLLDASLEVCLDEAANDNLADTYFIGTDKGSGFKMPENFDIPHEDIQKIIHKSSSLNPSTPSSPSPPTGSPQPASSSSSSSPATGSEKQPGEKEKWPEKFTYYSTDHSSKATKATKRHNSGDAKRNRKRHRYAELFGDCSQESEECVPDYTPKNRKEFETCGGTATILSEIPDSKETGRNK